MCQRCYNEGKNIFYSVGTTSHVNSYLNEVHQLYEHGSLLPITSSIPILDFAQFKEFLIHWIVNKHISFSQVENEDFRNLLLYLNSQLGSHLPSSGNTIRN